MTPIQTFYLAQAAAAGRSAASASLVNVRDRHLLAEISWNGLAVRAGRVGTLQAARLAEAPAPLPMQERS